MKRANLLTGIAFAMWVNSAVAHEVRNGGDTIIDGIRDRMLFAGEFVRENRPEVAAKMKSLEHYLEVVKTIPIILVDKIVDPDLGILTGRTTKVPKTTDNPWGWRIEFNEDRWRKLLNGKLVTSKGPENDPFRTPFHEGLLASEEEDRRGEISSALFANTEDFEAWQRARHPKDPSTTTERSSQKITIRLYLRGGLYVYEPGKEEQLRAKAIQKFFEDFPASWSDEYAAKIRAAISPFAKVLKIVVQRERQIASVIPFPHAPMESVVTGHGSPIYRGGPPSTRYKLIHHQRPYIGLHVWAPVVVEVFIDPEKFQLERIQEHPAIEGEKFTFSEDVPNATQARDAYVSAQDSYLKKCTEWRERIRTKYRNSPTDRLVYVQNCYDFLVESVEVASYRQVVTGEGFAFRPVTYTANVPSQASVRYVNPYPEVWVLTEKRKSSK